MCQNSMHQENGIIFFIMCILQNFSSLFQCSKRTNLLQNISGFVLHHFFQADNIKTLKLGKGCPALSFSLLNSFLRMKIDHLEGGSVHRELVTKMITSYLIKTLDQFCFCLVIVLQTKGHTSLILHCFGAKQIIIGSVSPSNEMC